MTIKSLTVCNFRSVKDASVNFGPGFNIGSGDRGLGKTSLFGLALSAAFTQSNALTTEDGKKIAAQIREGAERFELTCKFIHEGENYTIVFEVESDGARGLVVKGLDAPAGFEKQQTALWNLLGTNAATLRAIFDIRQIATRPQQEVTELILSFCQGDVEIDADHRALMVKYGLIEEDERIKTFSRIDGLYDIVYKKRTKATAAVKKIAVGPEPVWSNEKFPNQGEAYYQQKLRRFTEESVKLSKDAGWLEGQIVFAARNNQIIEDAKGQDVMVKPEPPEVISAQLDEIGQQIADLNASINGLRVDESRLRNKIAKAESSVKGKSCDECGAPYTEKRRESRLESLRSELSLATGAIRTAEATLTEARKVQGQAKEEYARRRAAMQAWEASQRQIPGEPIDVTPLKVDLEKANAGLAESNRKAESARKYILECKAIAAWEKARDEFRAAECEVEDLGVLCEILGPKGVRLQLAKKADPFMELLRSVASTYRLECAFTPEEGLTVNGRPPAHLSGGDQRLLEIGFRRALAVHSKVAVITLDNTAPMTRSETQAMYKHLEELAQTGLQILLTETSDTRRDGVIWFERTPDGNTKVTSPTSGSEPRPRKAA